MEVPHAHNQTMAGNQLEGLLIFPKNRQQLQQLQQQQQQEEIKKPRPHQEQPLKCPRCASTNTKFCYYNNYSLSQPRYFCKACRRYWTQGGSLRNVPVGGGCRKNKTRNPSSSTSTMSSTSTVSSSSSKNKPQDLIINPPLLPPASTNSFHIPPLTSNDLSLAFSGLNKQLLLDHHSSLLAHANSTGGFLDILRSGSIDALSNSNLYFGGGGSFAANDHHHHHHNNNNNNVSTGEGGVLSCNNVKSMAEGGMGGDASMRMVQTVDTGGGGGGGDWNGSGVVGNSWHGLINGGRIMDNVSSSTTLGDAYAFF